MSKVGRPAVPGTPVTFRFTPDVFEQIKSGAKDQASQLTRSHPKGHSFSPNSAHWLRSLIDYGHKHRKDIPAEVIRAAMIGVTNQPDDMQKLSMILPEEQRVKLRKYECACQALNWSLDLNRNATINLMVQLHASAFNDALRSC